VLRAARKGVPAPASPLPASPRPLGDSLSNRFIS
jgi:hypothetical protein